MKNRSIDPWLILASTLLIYTPSRYKDMVNASQVPPSRSLPSPH